MGKEEKAEKPTVLSNISNKISKGLISTSNSIKSNSIAFAGNLVALFSGKKRIMTEKNEIMKEFYHFEEVRGVEKHSKYTKKEKQTFIVLTLLAVNIILLSILYICSYSMLRGRILTNSVFYIIPAIVIPFWTWVISTNENYWAFHKRKRTFFSLCCINMALVVFQPIYTRIVNFTTGIVCKIEPDKVMTQGMIDLLATLMVTGLSAIVIVIAYTQVRPLIESPSLKRNIDLFKLQHHVDNREEKEFKYDMRIIKKLEDGSDIAIKENDRFVQTVIDGPSGTGKTSSIFITSISNDMDTMLKNREKRQECLLEMIQKRKATIKGPLREFKESAIIPVGSSKAEFEKNKKELEKIRKKYPDCGITVVAPNNSLITDIIRLAEARNIKVNVLDPLYDYSEYKNARQVGINPFYIPLGMEETERLIRISEAATVFSDVLIATNQMDGEGDPYFTDISLAVSSNVSTVIMLANNIEGKQTYIEDVQNCIGNFQNLQEYVNKIETHYGISVAGAGSQTKTKMTADDIVNQQSGNTSKGNGSSRKAKANPYYQQLLFVKQELLGAGAEDMFNQARGLRNLINKILQDPRIRTRLSAEKENRIDFDGILANNEITVVNTGIELGKSTSTAFGLFFILLHKTSVLRRPIKTRTPHFLWIDEATQYMHPCYEDMISLFRQYRCAVVITLQSLSQTERSRATAYLKEVFLGAGTHIVFGRLTPDEMKLYSEMGGITRDIEEQKSYTKSSILNENTSYTESVRATPTLNNVLEASDMRILGFQELTIFTIDNARVLPGQHGRVFFITDDNFDKKPTKTILWEKVVPEAFRIPPETEMEQDEQEQTDETKYEKPKPSEKKGNTHIEENQVQSVVIQTRETEKQIEDKNPDSMSLEEIFAFLDTEPTDAQNTTHGNGTSGSKPPKITIPTGNPESDGEDGEMSQEEMMEALRRYRNK